MNSCSNAIQETILRGSPDCPFEFYHIDKNHPKFAMTFHYHLDFEIIRVLKGTFSLYINERHYDLQRGQYIFIEGGKVHGGKPDLYSATLAIKKTGSVLYLSGLSPFYEL